MGQGVIHPQVRYLETFIDVSKVDFDQTDTVLLPLFKALKVPLVFFVKVRA